MSYKVQVLLTVLFATLFADAAPYVTNVVAKQRYPWNGLVDVKYEIVGSTNEISGYVYGSLKAEDRGAGKVYPASTFVKPLDLSEGVHHAIWNMSADVEVVSTNLVFSISIEKPALYLVVDLSAGKDATSYPVSELSDVPVGGWSDVYKTMKLVLRLIDAGSFKMGGRYDVTLTKPYYMGVFEVTQKQYELVVGSNPSGFKGDTLPVECVSWNSIRGDSSIHNWPTVKTVDANSFIGRLQARTRLNFDLPTEAQWEYACRAGTITTYYWGDSINGDYAWYRDNSGGSTHVVGMCIPNAWGLYDMSGNVWEWCLDWYGNLLNSTDPVGSSSGRARVMRGSYWNDGASECSSSCRSNYTPLYGDHGHGFRLVRTL